MTRTQGDFVGAAAIWSSELALLDAECCRRFALPCFVVLYFVGVRGMEIWLGGFWVGSHDPVLPPPRRFQPFLLVPRLPPRRARHDASSPIPRPRRGAPPWRSDEQEQPTLPQWVRKEVHLPR